MKILYHHRIRSKDGQFVHVEELVGALREAGHEVVIVGPAHVANARFGADAGMIVHLKRWLSAPFYEVLELLYNLPALARIMWVARRERPDFIYERYNLFFPAGTWSARWLGVPLLLEVNAPLFEERSRFGGISLSRVASWSERTAWRAADQVLTVTEVLARRIESVGVSRARITVVHNGIDQRKFSRVASREAAKQALGLADRQVLGFVGFVRSWHGLDAVLRFLVSEPGDLHLLVVGDGPARADLEAQARTLGIAHRVTFTGVVARESIPRHVAAFDVALQPAVVEYASPLKLFEYMALGCAIAAPDSENIREILLDGKHARLFDAQRPDSMVAAVRQLCRDADLRRRLGAAAAQRIEELGLTWRQNAERVIAIGREALLQRRVVRRESLPDHSSERGV